jgi:glycosyltransferase involved in cell wall biosynthesis
MTGPSVIAVIPARNEGQTIAQVVAGARAHCAGVVVVDDASTDDTSAMADGSGADVVLLSDRGGYGAAILAGFRFLGPRHVDEIVTLDGDGAHDPAEIPDLLAAHRAAGAALTVGDRFSVPEVHLPSSKRWSNYLASRLCRHACGVALADVACGFRVYGGGIAAQLVRMPFGGGYAFAYEGIAAVARLGGVVAGAPVSARYDASTIGATPSGEFLDFIAGLSAMYIRGGAPPYLQALREAVTAADAFTIRMAGETLCIHRVGDRFLFQAQSPAYADRAAGLVIDVRETS